MELRQPDGTIVSAERLGDEHGHILTDSQHHPLVLNQRGYYERTSYSVKEALSLARQERQARKKASSAGDAKYVYSSAAFPTKGDPHSIVVLVEYQDVKFSVEDPKSYYEDYLNGEDFRRDNATGSCRQYFIDNSNGKFQPTFDVYGPVPLANVRSYYGGNVGGNDRAVEEMVIEAVDYLDATVDFSQYDHNKDKYVDSIYLIYAGVGESDSDVSDSVWPQSWELELSGYTKKVDGVWINAYGCSNEISDGKPRGIGVFVHEFCHVLGLPDLYNTDNFYDTTTPLQWSLMDEGSYTNDSRTPPCLSAFERYSLGWITPEEILSSGDYHLSSLNDNAKAYLMTTEENEDEFFILENRQQKGWDAYLPGHGMMIWHIDFYQGRWDRNKPNYLTDHPCVRIMRADNDKSPSTFAGDPFPGTSGAVEFSSSTTPGLLSWDRKELNVTSIYEIQEQEVEITFLADVSEERGKPGTTGLRETTQNSPEFQIRNGVVYCTEGHHPVFDTLGRVIGVVTPSNPFTLYKGVFIVNGHKIANLN